MSSSKKQENASKTEVNAEVEAIIQSLSLIDHSGYEGFCLGIDILLHVMGKDTMSDEIINILERIRDGELHMPRRQLLSKDQQMGYDSFARQVARRALNVLANVDLSNNPEGNRDNTWN